MCGRTSLFVGLDELESRFDATHESPESYGPRYNIAPEQSLDVITGAESDSIKRFSWGLVPFWADSPDDAGWINARSETASEKPGFREAWKNRPCIIPSTGFYEWKGQNGGRKQPYRIHRQDEIFSMAGLWEHWEDDDSEQELYSVTILTTDANSLMDPIHDRMPVILQEEDESGWLSGDSEERKSLCRPYGADDLEAYTITTAVNNPGNDSASVIDPQGTEQSGLDSFS